MSKNGTMLSLLYEHNTLNGFWFVLIEFILVAVVALFMGWAGLSKGNILWSVAWLGIAVNAAAICATVIRQMRRGENSSSIAKTYFGEGGKTARREHPDLDRHTFEIVVATLVPFFLAVRTLLGR